MMNEEIEMKDLYIGKLMERAEWYAKIEKMRRVRTDFGPRTLYKFVTRSGRKGLFFSETIQELDEGVCFVFKGTVKKHEFNEYDKQHETTFNRVEIIKIVGKLVDTD